MTQLSRLQKLGLIFLILAIGLVAACTPVFMVEYSKNCFIWSGEHLNSSPSSFYVIQYIFVGFIITGASLAILVIECLVSFQKSRYVEGGLGGLLILLTVAGVVVAAQRFEPGYLHFMTGYERWARKSLPTSVIRQWARELEENRPESEIIDRLQWPPAIQKISPQQVMIGEDGSLYLIWGGGFGHWGVIVKSSPNFVSQIGSVYTRQIEDNLVIFHEIQ